MEKHDETLQYPPAHEVPKEVDYPRRGNYIELYIDKVYGACMKAREGDKYTFLGFDPVEPGLCGFIQHSVHNLVSAMAIGVSAVELGIAKEGEDGYAMCPAWGPPTCEAQVIVRLHPVPMDKMAVDEWYEFLATVGHFSVPSYFLENFASEETKEDGKKLTEQWVKAGRPRFWEGWRRLPTQLWLEENKESTEKAYLDRILKKE